MRKYKTIMELIFIFLIPLILILSGINLKEEQITTNSGYEWNTYIEYENKILVEMGEYKNIIQNFNIWNEEWDNCYWNETNNGIKSNSNVSFGCNDYIKINSNTNYYYNFPSNNDFWVLFYDETKNLITAINNRGPRTYTTPNNAEYTTFYSYNSYDLTYKNNICINISINWANGYYEPYGEPLIIYSETDISGQNNRIYTPFGAIKNLIIDNFKIQQNTTTDILFDYTIIWFLMFILWHVLYLFFDMLIHLFIDWGHKEKEKINE